MSNHNEPAFPVSESLPFGWQVTGELPKKGVGLTKREYFAGLAMQGLLASPQEDFCGQEESTMQDQYDACAKHAVCYADALLAELEKAK